MKLPRSRLIARCIPAAALATCLLTACSAEPSTPTKYQLPENAQFSYRWTATPGLDLNSDAAIVIRAAVESAFLATMTRTYSENNVGKYTYPGYTRAVDPAMGDKDQSIYKTWDASRLDVWGSVHGTAYPYLVSLQKAADYPTTHVVEALTCLWLNGVSVSLNRPDEYRSPFNSALVPQAIKMKLRAPQDETPKLTSFGQGSARYPTTDVFGDWSVESMDVNSSWINAWTRKPYDDPCAALPGNPVPPEQLATTTLTFYQAHLPTLDPSPGWPADAERPTTSAGDGK